MPSHKKWLSSLGLGFSLFLTLSAFAAEIQVKGEGSTDITPNVEEVQYRAKKEATNAALIMALQRILGPDAVKDQKVKEKFSDVSSQLNVYKVNQTYNARRENTKYFVTTELIIDETKFRQLLSDMGISRVDRSNSILTIMEEYFTTPSDLKTPIPLKDSTYYRYDLDTKYKEDEKRTGSEMEARANSTRDQKSGSLAYKDQSSASFSGRQQGNLSASGRTSSDFGSSSGRVNASEKESVDAKASNKTSLDAKLDTKSSRDSASLKKAAHDDRRSVEDTKSEHEYYERVIEYQKRSAPGKQNYALSSLQSAFRAYDLRIMDNDLFKSRYFKDKPITIEELNNSAELSNYAQYARKDAKADYFVIGTSLIVDNGRDKGVFNCDGNVEIKVYSTLDSEIIGSGSITESSTGSSPDQCRQKVAKKIGERLGKDISNQIMEYSKKRQIYGSEYVVLLIGEFPPLKRAQFTKTLKDVKGVTEVKPRRMDGKEFEFIVTYNGGDPLADSIFMQLASSPLSATFSDYDFALDGKQIKLYPIGGKGGKTK